MSEHITTTGDYNFLVRYPDWLHGSEAYNMGLMYDAVSNKLDIFGWMFKASDYTRDQFSGFRVPSQFAQKVTRSGRQLNGIASHLTTSTHTDTPFAISLGKINDDISLDIFKREAEIAKLLKTKSIGVSFIEKLIEFPNWDGSKAHAIDLFVSSIAWLDKKQLAVFYRQLTLSGYRLYYKQTTESYMDEYKREYIVCLVRNSSVGKPNKEPLLVKKVNYKSLISMSVGDFLNSDMRVIVPFLKEFPMEDEFKAFLGINLIPVPTAVARPILTQTPYEEVPVEEECDCGDCRRERGEYVEDDEDDE